MTQSRVATNQKGNFFPTIIQGDRGGESFSLQVAVATCRVIQKLRWESVLQYPGHGRTYQINFSNLGNPYDPIHIVTLRAWQLIWITRSSSCISKNGQLHKQEQHTLPLAMNKLQLCNLGVRNNVHIVLQS